MTGAFLKLDPSNMIKVSQQKKLKINIQTEIAADHIMDLWESHTFPYVPAEEHYLEGSFTSKMLMSLPTLKMKAQYDAVSNKGYHYAAYQHENKLDHFKKPPKKFIKPGAVDHFLSKGMFEVNVIGEWSGRIRPVLENI